MNANILDFGAISDGVTLNTAAIQRAIDECSVSGGGRVLVPAGVYKCGSIWLRSGVELHIEMGAELLASDNLDDYNELDAYGQNGSSEVEGWVGKHLIIAHEIENVAITGLGIINGNCHAFVTEDRDYPQYRNAYLWADGVSRLRDAERCRPGQLICFIECANVRVFDVTIKDSPCWSCYFLGCAYVSVRGIKVKNPKWMYNSDGIDIDASRYVTVSDCIIETGDDAIAIRACEKKLRKRDIHCECVTVTNCILSTSICAFRLGVGTGVIRHVRVSNIIINRACNAVQFCTAYSEAGCANIEGVSFSGISCDNTERLIEAFAKNGAYIRDVVLENIRSTSSMQNYIDATDGEIDGFVMRNVKLDMLDKYENMTSELLALRGERSLFINGAKNVELCNIKIVGELKSSCGVALATHCENLRAYECSFDMEVKNI